MKSTQQGRVIKIIASNRRARHDFEILNTYEAGIVLQGTEVKSLREGRASLQDAYAGFKSSADHEIYLNNAHINPYEHGNRENHEPKRMRKLLLNAREIKKIKQMIQEKGLTVIPLSLYFSGHLVKVELGVARAKRKYDKRETTKERESEREIQRKLKY
jgi:SsrA-binding protein